MKFLSFFYVFLCLVFCANGLTAHPGIGIVLNQSGTIYYTDLDHVWQIKSDGTHSIAVKNVHTHQLFLDEEDNLYGEHIWYEGEATDKWGHYIWCLGNDGTFEKMIPDQEGFPINNRLIRDQLKQEYWAEKVGDYQVLKKKTMQGQITSASDHHFQDIQWINTSKNSTDVYVVDHLSLKKVNQDGELSIIAQDLKEGGLAFSGVSDRHYLMGSWTDEADNVYLAVYGARKIKKIEPDGSISTYLKSPAGWSVSGGIFAPNGDLWLMEFSLRNKTRVRKITPDGQSTVFKS